MLNKLKQIEAIMLDKDVNRVLLEVFVKALLPSPYNNSKLELTYSFGYILKDEIIFSTSWFNPDSDLYNHYDEVIDNTKLFNKNYNTNLSVQLTKCSSEVLITFPKKDLIKIWDVCVDKYKINGFFTHVGVLNMQYRFKKVPNHTENILDFCSKEKVKSCYSKHDDLSFDDRKFLSELEYALNNEFGGYPVQACITKYKNKYNIYVMKDIKFASDTSKKFLDKIDVLKEKYDIKTSETYEVDDHIVVQFNLDKDHARDMLVVHKLCN